MTITCSVNHNNRKLTLLVLKYKIKAQTVIRTCQYLTKANPLLFNLFHIDSFSMNILAFSFTLIFLLTTASSELKNGGKHWAVIVAGSNGYDNYRHQVSSGLNLGEMHSLLLRNFSYSMCRTNRFFHIGLQAQLVLKLACASAYKTLIVISNSFAMQNCFMFCKLFAFSFVVIFNKLISFLCICQH